MCNVHVQGTMWNSDTDSLSPRIYNHRLRSDDPKSPSLRITLSGCLSIDRQNMVKQRDSLIFEKMYIFIKLKVNLRVFLLIRQNIRGTLT